MMNNDLENNCALIAHLESDNENLSIQKHMLGSINEPRLYEEEAIRCFSSWREKAGWLKNIPIYTLCCTKNHPSKETISKLKDLNVQYIEDYLPESEDFSCSFFTIPYVGKYFESLHPIKEKITINLDLDCIVLHPIPKSLIEKSLEETVVGVYPIPKIFQKERMCFDFLPSDTSLIISHRKFDFYSLYYDLCFDEKVLNSPKWKEIKEKCEKNGGYSSLFYLEEFVVDYIRFHHLKKIFPLIYYQYGDGYPSLGWLIKNKHIDHLLFLHDHLKYKTQKRL